jgi:hypothetical protein
MVGEESEAELLPQPTVNNFVAATGVATLGWPGSFICGYPSNRFPAPAGQVF